MKLQEVINLAEGRDLKKSYIKSDGLYIWDYKLQFNQELGLDLVLISSDSGKAGFKDKVSVDEIVTYIKSEWAAGTVPYGPFDQIKIIGAEGITIAKI
jgi:hypothetical protein